MFSNFLPQAFLKSKLKDLPEQEREKILRLVERDPELFASIAKEAWEDMQKGKSQTQAIEDAARAHAEELRKLNL